MNKNVKITRKSRAGPMKTSIPNNIEEDRTRGAIDMMDAEMDDDLYPQKRNLKKTAVAVDGKVRIITEIDHTKEFLCCKYDEECKLIAGGLSDGSLMIYNSNNGDLAFKISDRETDVDVAPVTAIQHRPLSTNYPISNTFTCSYGNGCIKCWNHKFQKCIYTIREKRQTYGIKFHPIQPKFVTYGDNDKIYLYDEETKTQEHILEKSEGANKHDGHVSRIFASCFNPRSLFEMVSGGWDNVIQFWDVRQPHAVRHISGIHMCGEGIDINIKGTEILVAAWQNENPLQLYDYGTGKLITTLEPDIYNSKLYCGKYVTKDFILTGGIDPNLVRIIDLQTHVTVASINNLMGGVYNFSVGKLFKVKKSEKVEQTRGSDITTIPRIAFVSGKKIYQIEF